MFDGKHIAEYAGDMFGAPSATGRNVAGGSITLTPLPLRGLPVSNSFAGAALSPDGAKLAVENLGNGPAQITHLGAVRTATVSATRRMEEKCP